MKGGRKINMPDKVDPGDSVFRSVPSSSPAFLIWRLENLQLIPVPKCQYGTFYDSDSYIIYAASEPGKFITSEQKVRAGKGIKLEVHVHSWVGVECCDEEKTTALYRAYALSQTCRPPAVLHREPMGHESPRFKAYFPHIRVYRGTGSETDDKFEARLLRVSGRRRAVVRQTASLDRSALVPRGVFILDTRDVVFLWVGKDSDPAERLQATRVAMSLKEEHNAVSIVFVDQGKESNLSSSEQLLLNVYLRPHDNKQMSDVVKEEDDDARLDVDSKPVLKLYKCSDSDGIYKISEMKSGPPIHHSDLDPNGCYIVDNWWEGVWVWVGRGAGQQAGEAALGTAQGYIRKKRYPEGSTRLTRVPQHSEPNEFISLFVSWPQPNSNGVGKMLKDEIGLGGGVGPGGDCALSKLEIWRVEGSAGSLHPLSSLAPPVFYSRESYIIRYSLPAPDETSVDISTYWIGEECEDEVNWREMGEAMGVVLQGREPAHLLSALSGRLMVLSGRHCNSLPPSFLLRVSGNAKHNTSAQQVDGCGESLEAIGVYVVVVSGVATYVWCGRRSTGDSREMAKAIASSLTADNDYTVVYQGQEKEDFWDCLGGKVDTDMSGLISQYSEDGTNYTDRIPRLFHMSPTSGSIRVEEILNFSQTDLICEDMMLLDAFHTIFLWIGHNVKREEKNKTLHYATEFMKFDVSGRDRKMPIMQIQEGNEPLIFTKYFNHWNHNESEEEESYASLRDMLEKEKPLLQVELEPTRPPPADFDSADKFPLPVLLQKDPTQLPYSIDLLHKECHLSGNDFNRLFGMEYDDFVKLPNWRQVSMKKEVGLF